jgi:hypothetical protein
MASSKQGSMEFFELRNVVRSPEETEHVKLNPTLGDAPRCPNCGLPLGMLTWLPPYRIELIRYGKNWGDISFGTGYDLLVSEAFRESWMKEGLQGLDQFDPVEVRRIRPKSASRTVPTYYRIHAPISITRIDEARSIVVADRKPTCEYCSGHRIINAIKGFSIDESSWAGEDMFRPRNLSGRLIVTERFKKIVESHRLKNVNLILVEDCLWDPLHKFSTLS